MVSYIICEHMSEDLSKKQKKRQVKRIHKLLFEYHNLESDSEEKRTVSLKPAYQDVFNKHFPTEIGFSFEELENRISECIDNITDMLIVENDAINEEYAHGVITNIILQFVGQAIDVEVLSEKGDGKPESQNENRDFMYW